MNRALGEGRDKASRSAQRLIGLVALVIGALLCAFYFWGIPKTPFHPDESTQLWMSRDLEILLSSPLAMAWTEGRPGDLAQHYRLIDAPLTRYLLGAGRMLGGQPAIAADWNWSKTWAENRSAGALPDEKLLLSGRFFLGLLFPFDLLLIYAIGRRLEGPLTGLLALSLFGLNALILLHTRRAMAEAALTCGVLLAIWSFLKVGWKTWLSGLTLAIAVSAKQTAAALIPVGLLAAALIPAGLLAAALPESDPSEGTWSRRWLQILVRWAEILAVFGLVTLALNPIFWKKPLSAARAGWAERQDLVDRMTRETAMIDPANTLNSPSRRLAASIAHLYLTPPLFAETANYQYETRQAELVYQAVPGHNLLRGVLAGGILFVLTLAGMLLALLDLRRAEAGKRRAILVLMAATLCLGGGVIWLAPLPWQRYVLPVVPLICVWIAFSLARFCQITRNREESYG